MEEHKVFSLAEISIHSIKNDCWLTIDGKVFDITKYLEEHPGGEELLLEASTKGDATKAFDEVGHSSTATSIMTDYFIGVVEGSDPLDAVQLKKEPEVEEGGFVEVKTSEVKKPSTCTSLVDFLIPLLILGVALGAWYFYNKDKERAP